MELGAYPTNRYCLKIIGISFYEYPNRIKLLSKGIRKPLRTELDFSLEDESVMLLWN